jgi:5-formyltetrahydrofolate cyclo-ligase
MNLRPAEFAYWQKYLVSVGGDENLAKAFVSASHAGNAQITDEFLELYFSGKKTAGSSLMEDFLAAGDPLPTVGNHWIYLNSKDEPSCILRTEKVVRHKFKDVPVSIAIAEGEGDLSLDYWKRVHAELYQPYLQAWGVSDLNEATVITEFFKIVYR